MSDEEDQLRRMLAARADRVRSHLSGPAIRARAQARRPIRRYAPVLTAAAVLAVTVVSLVLLRHGSTSGPAQVPPAATVSTTMTSVPPTITTASPKSVTSSPAATTTPSQLSSTPMGTTETATSN